MADPRPTEALKLTLLDGKEREFLLTMGGVRRVVKRLGLTSEAELSRASGIDAIIVTLHEGCLDKGDLSEGEFAELLPATRITDYSVACARLLGLSMPEPDGRPMPASPSPGTGSDSGPLPESTSG